MANFFKDYQAQLKAQRTEAERIEAERIAAKEAEEHRREMYIVASNRAIYIEQAQRMLDEALRIVDLLIETTEDIPENHVRYYTTELEEAAKAINATFDHIENAGYIVEA